MSLTSKQQLFIDEYLKCPNATEAARQAGYEGNDNTLGSVGWENLQKPAIISRIKQRLSESAMLADEALAILADQARADFGPYLIVGKEGVGVDVQAMKDAGLTHLIKSVTPVRDGTKIEFYDKQAAINMLLKAHGAFTQNLDITTGGQSLLRYLGNVDPDEL